MAEISVAHVNKKVLSLIPLAVTPGAIVPTSNFLGRQVQGGPAGGGGQVRHHQDKWLSSEVDKTLSNL